MSLNKKSTIVMLASAVVLVGCSSTIHKIRPLGNLNTLSIDAKQRLVLSSETGGWNRNEPVACAEPSPDALVAQAAAISGSLTSPESVGAAIGAASNESAGSIGLRTQTIQILRDGYYRICEAYQNGALSKADYQRVLLGVDSFITVVAAIETIGGTTRAPAVAISPGAATTSATGDDATAQTSAGTVEIENISQESGTISKDQANAIAKVVVEYLKFKKEVLNNHARSRGHH